MSRFNFSENLQTSYAVYMSRFMAIEERRTLMTAFIESKFNYCLLIWILYSKTFNNKIIRIHKRALRFVYFDYKSSFNELLDNDDSFRIYHKNGKGLANRIYKCLYSLSPAT